MYALPESFRSDVQYKSTKPELDCKYGAHLNFETYGKLNSYVWRENAPFPQDPSLITCDVTYGEANCNASLLRRRHRASQSSLCSPEIGY